MNALQEIKDQVKKNKDSSWAHDK